MWHTCPRSDTLIWSFPWEMCPSLKIRLVYWLNGPYTLASQIWVIIYRPCFSSCLAQLGKWAGQIFVLRNIHHERSIMDGLDLIYMCHIGMCGALVCGAWRCIATNKNPVVWQHSLLPKHERKLYYWVCMENCDIWNKGMRKCNKKIKNSGICIHVIAGIKKYNFPSILSFPTEFFTRKLENESCYMVCFLNGKVSISCLSNLFIELDSPCET